MEEHDVFIPRCESRTAPCILDTHVEEKEAYIVKPTAYGSRTVRVKCCFLQHHFFYRIGMGWGGCNADVPSSCTPA